MPDCVTHDGVHWSNAGEDRILLREWDSRWPAEFEKEARAIRAQLSDSLGYSIEHVGSTAVPGLVAKPIIDIVLAVPDQRRWPELIAPLERLSYSHFADNPDTSRMFFVKGMPPFGAGRTHHVGVCTPDALEPLVRFRDFLIAHPADARRYEALKRELAARFERDRERYTEGKSKFIQELLRSDRNG